MGVLVANGLDQLTVQHSPGIRITRTLLITLGLALLLVGALNSFGALRWHVDSVVVFYLAGVWLPVVGLLMRRWQRVTFDARNAMMCIKGPFGFREEIPFADMDAVETAPSSSTPSAGKLTVVLLKPPGRRIKVIDNTTKSRLQSDAVRLAAFLNLPLRDVRKLPVPGLLTPDGLEILVERRLVSHAPSASFRAQQAVEIRPGLLAIKPTIQLQVIRACFLAFGLFAFAMGANLFFWGEDPSPIGRLLGLLLPLLIGSVLCAAAWFIGGNPVFLDRSRGEIRGRKLKVSGRRVERWPLAAVAAVQVVDGIISGGESSYHAYQINLVLNDPPGDRLALMAFSDRQRILVQANRLAEFLGVPLLDHEAAKTPTELPAWLGRLLGRR